MRSIFKLPQAPWLINPDRRRRTGLASVYCKSKEGASFVKGDSLHLEEAVR